MKNKTLLILNGPGLADLGIGGDKVTLGQIEDACSALCDELDINLDFRQTDDEDEMFRWITEDNENVSGLIINPLGYANGHAVDFDMCRSAIKTFAVLNKPLVEVHLTNIFRQGDVQTKPLQGPEGKIGFVCGLGIHSYLLGIKAVAERLQN